MSSFGNIGGSGGSGSSSDKELVNSIYIVKNSFTNASIGDVLVETKIFDVSSASPSLVSTMWRNQTTDTDLASAPSLGDLILQGTSGAAVQTSELLPRSSFYPNYSGPADSSFA